MNFESRNGQEYKDSLNKAEIADWHEMETEWILEKSN